MMSAHGRVMAANVSMRACTLSMNTGETARALRRLAGVDGIKGFQSRP